MNLNNLDTALNYDCWLWFPRGSHFSWELPNTSRSISSLQTIWSCHSRKLYPKEKEKLLRMAAQLIWRAKTTLSSVKLRWLTTLCSARTGLIFTRHQEGTQQGGWTKTAKQKWVFDTMCRHAGFWLGELAGQVSRGSEAREALGGESCSVHFRCMFCIFSLSVLLLLLFASFAVLFNCPYPDPRDFAFFFPFSSPSQWGKGR